MSSELIDLLACKYIPNFGAVTTRKAITALGNVAHLFQLTKSKLTRISGIGDVTAESIINNRNTARLKAEKEIDFCIKNNIDILSYYDNKFPTRLKQLDDAPMFLFVSGKPNFNDERYVAIVGTRNATEYGKQFTEKLVDKLSSHNIKIISGLAYGIDITAHKACIKNDMYNIAVLGQGLHTIYPSLHKKYAQQIKENGCLVSEFTTDDEVIPENFPKRNRIVAGMCDAIIIIETDVKGGSMITANIAHSYNKDVFALPGNIDVKSSSGCNFLIKKNMAQLIENADDVISAMLWDKEILPKKQSITQRNLFHSFSINEQKIMDEMNYEQSIQVDELRFKTQLTNSELASNLLKLEMEGFIKSMPGARYIKCLV